MASFIDLIILDNLSTLLTSRSEAASDAWVPKVQSLCPEMERAKQWLSANGLKIAAKLDDICKEIGPPGRHLKGFSRRGPGSA